MRRKMRTVILIVTATFALSLSQNVGLCADGSPGESRPVVGRPPEALGIHWETRMANAVLKATSQHKPILVFVESSTDPNSARLRERVSRHPLIAEAVSTLFVPLHMEPNDSAARGPARPSQGQRASTHALIRIVTSNGHEFAPSVRAEATLDGLIPAMVTALQRSGQPTPPYLSLIAEELVAERRGVSAATFAMHCFWEGESALGAIAGVVSTRPGFIGKDEVVEVTFDPSAIALDELVRRAESLQCADKVYVRSKAEPTLPANRPDRPIVYTTESIRPDKQPKYYLAQTSFRHVPMTSLQSSRVNAAIHRRNDPRRYLSPGQIRLLNAVERHPKAGWPNAIGASDFVAAWAAAEQISRSLP